MMQTEHDKQIKNALLQQQQQAIKVEENQVIACTKCGSDIFVSGIRLAKSKINLGKEAVGMLNEKPIVFCIQCGHRLPDDIKDVFTKKELLDREEQKNKESEVSSDSDIKEK